MSTRLKILDTVKKEGRKLLTEIESKQLLSQIGIKTVETLLAASREEAITLAQQLGFPVGLKIASPDVVHKTDAGGVKLGLTNSKAVGQAYDDIMTAINEHFPQARILGVSVQQMARPGIEVIMGMSRDPQFGPVIMFGLGGVMVEILKDVSLRLVPLSRRDAREMIQEIKGYPLLCGYRGAEPVDIENLEEWLLRLSGFIAENPEIKELDLNPIFAYRDGALAVDARVVIE